MAHGPPHRSTCFPHFISVLVETSLLQAGVTLLARRHCSTLASLFLSEWSDPSMYGTRFIRALNLIDNRHALADIMIPEDQPNRHESTRFDDAKTWSVYAKYEVTSDSLAIGDLFVLTREGSLVMTIIGCRFMKLSIATLTRVLVSSNPDLSPRKTSAMSLSETAPTFPIGSSQSFPEETSESIVDLSGLPTKSFTPPIETEQQYEMELREIISAYTGISCSAIAKDAVIADLGVGSLTVVEIVEELAARFGKEVSSEGLATRTFGSLLEFLTPDSSSSPSRGHGSPDKEQPKQTAIGDTSPDSRSDPDIKHYQALCEILEEDCGPLHSAIEQHKTVGELGIDSLSMVEMKGQFEETFDIKISDDRFCFDSRALDIMKFLGIKLPGSRKSSNQGEVARDASIRSSPLEDRASFHQAEPVSSSFINPIEALVKAESKLHQAATKHGFVEYWSTVAPIQNKLSASYILEAYETLGIDISKIGAGNTVGPMPCLPKYSRLAQRFLDILKKEDIVYQRGQEYLHSERKSYSKPSRVLLEQLVTKWPQYEIEVKMMALSGPRLAECLSGKVDPVSLFFANPTSSKILEDWYSKAPLLATMTDQLVELICNLLPSQDLA